MGRLAGLGAFLLVADATKKGVRLDSSFSLQLLRAETSGENDGVGACLMHPQCIVPAFCCAKKKKKKKNVAWANGGPDSLQALVTRSEDALKTQTSANHQLTGP